MTLIGDETTAGVKNLGIPWEFVRQRPDKVAGCQEVSQITDLPEGQTSCEEGQTCFYFSCGKCSSILALDTLNFEYKKTMQFVPRITCIPAPETFEEDNQYHGEITEIYWKFLAQLRPGLKGIGINGWSSNNARKIFKRVGETFSGVKKIEKSKDFEIDWILFNGHTITVIEVKERSRIKRGKEGGRERNFESKVDQIKKDRIIMQHLLKVTGCQHVRVNYVIACPNVSISEVVQGRLLENHQEVLQEILGSGDTMSFISEECMSSGKVYMYHKDESDLSWIDFREVLEPYNSGNTNATDNTHFEWLDNYRWLASSVIVSILVIGNEVNADSEHLVPGESNFQLKQSSKTRLLQAIPRHARKNFPECVVLGPEQLNAIKYGSDRCLLLGEPGSGKTLVLLYLLYKYTAKDLKEEDLKKVQFVIPEEKTELFKFLKSFVDNYCQIDYVDLIQLPTLDEFKANELCDLTLFDEFTVADEANFSRIDFPQKVFAAARYRYDSLTNSHIYWTAIYLRHCYRCSVNITSHYWKLSRIGNEPIFMSIALHKGVKVNDENDSFKILGYEQYCLREIYKMLPIKQFPEEKLLLVTTEKDILKLTEENDAQFTHSYSYTEDLNTNINRLQVNKLSFTGVHYHTVVIILSQFHQSYKTVYSLLYHSISRALNRVVVICHIQDYDNLHSLFLVNAAASQVFDRLKQLQVVRKEDFMVLNSKEDWENALIILIVTKNKDQFTNSVDLFSEKMGVGSVFNALMRNFPWGENGEMLDMIEALLSNYKFIPTLSEFMDKLLCSTEVLRLSSDIAKRRKLLSRFKTLMDDHGIQIDSYLKNSLFLLHLSIIWADKEWFTLFINNWKEKIESFSKFLAEILSELDDESKKHFNCDLVCQQKLFTSSTDNQRFFETHSSLTKTGRFRISEPDSSEGFIHLINKNHPVDQICCGTNQTLRRITKMIFWKYVESNYDTPGDYKWENSCLSLPLENEVAKLLPAGITSDDLSVLSSLKAILQNRIQTKSDPLDQRNESVLQSISDTQVLIKAKFPSLYHD